MKTKLNVGFVTTVSGRWPRALPQERYVKYGAYMKKRYSEYNMVTLESYIDDEKSLYAAIDTLKEQKVDVVVLQYGAFSGDDFGTTLAEELNVPIVLWALKEPDLMGGRLLANALVASTMNSASIKRLGKTCHFVFGNEDDERVDKELSELLTSYAILKELKKTMFGLLGYRPTAFYNSAFDEALIRRTFGIRMEETDLKVVFDKMATYSQDEVNQEISKINIPVRADLPEGHLENHARLALALREVISQNAYDYSALKCWPEMGNLHTTPCAVIGRLADEQKHIICEGDIDAGIAYIVENLLTSEPCFITDLINIDEKENTVTVWHCGNAAPSLISKKCKPEIGNHPLAGQGTAIRCTLKAGKVTLARFCNIDGKYKLFIASGEAVDTDMYTPGAMVNIRLNTPVREAIYKIVEEGVPHHYAVVWEDIASQMKALAKLMKMEIIEV